MTSDSYLALFCRVLELAMISSRLNLDPTVLFEEFYYFFNFIALHDV